MANRKIVTIRNSRILYRPTKRAGLLSRVLAEALDSGRPPVKVDIRVMSANEIMQADTSSPSEMEVTQKTGKLHKMGCLRPSSRTVTQ